MFGLPWSDRNKGYSGSGSYVYIDRLINGDSRAIKIITPFISPYYAKMLLKAAKSKKVYIIVSMTSKSRPHGGDSQAEALEMLDRQSRKPRIWIVLYFAALFSASISLGFYLIGAVLLSILFTATYFVFFRGIGAAPSLNLKVARGKFIHEKLYISDSEAITGSANLTYSGTHKNIEHIELIRDRSRIAELSRHFDELWRTY